MTCQGPSPQFVFSPLFSHHFTNLNKHSIRPTLCDICCRYGTGTERVDAARLSTTEGVLSERIQAGIPGCHVLLIQH